LKESTQRKLRQTVFRMLVDAGLLSGGGQIVPAVLSQRVAELLCQRQPGELRFFPTTALTTGGSK